MRNSRVILCNNINLDREYINVLNYTEEQMLELCLEHKVAEVNNYSFIRQNRDNLYTSFTYSQVLNSNYIAFQNKDYDNKWFFAFIDEVIYRGEKNTEIRYTIDSWSTWFNKLNIKPCLVKRHHVNDDSIGANTIEENIVNGVMIEEKSIISQGEFDNVYFAISTNTDPSKSTEYVGVNSYNGILNGKIIFLFDSDSVGITSLSYFIDHTNQIGRIADIESLFIIPKHLVGKNYETIPDTFTPSGHPTQITYEYKKLTKTNSAVENIDTLSFSYNYSDINVKNNKCYCYPYNFLQVTNNIGNIANYRFEEFGTHGTQPRFI